MSQDKLHLPTNTIHSKKCYTLHPMWDRSVEPVLAVSPGETFTLVSPDASNGALNKNSTNDDIDNINFKMLDPLCGPIYIEGAEIGDVIKVDLLELQTASWGWCGILNGFGLLSEEFTLPYFQSFDLIDKTIEVFGEKFTTRPMMGVLGVAPKLSGKYPSITPTNAGGNIDVRYLQQGSSLYLPVFNKGALLSGGDGHALQGEGEISGTAVETGMISEIKVEVIKGMEIKSPFADISTANYTETEYRDFLGIHNDLFMAARDAVLFAVDALSKSLLIDPIEAYAMMGIIGELRIHEIVDQPNWVVGCMIPLRLFNKK